LQFLFGLSGATPWTFTLDNVSLKLYAEPSMDLTWNDSNGYVRFIVHSVPPGFTVKRVHQGGNLVTLVGFEDDSWISGGEGFGEDYRAPLGETVMYVLCAVDAWAFDPAMLTGSVEVPGNQAWLRDPLHPVLSRKVTVITTGTEQEPARQFIYDISGRRLPLVVHDVRMGRRGTITLGVDGREERLAMEALLGPGTPLLLNICSSKIWAPCVMAIGNASFTRAGRGAKWTLDLDYVEVESPNVGGRVADPPWDDVYNGLPLLDGETASPKTWSWVKANYLNWLGVAIGSRAL
jgi:hypothetical protein